MNCVGKDMLKISLLGKIKIEFNDENLEPLLSRKIIALIYLMTANKGKYISRSKLMSYLWPDSSDEAARYNLRYNLWHLKNTLPVAENGESLIIAEKESCILNEDYPLDCDVITIKEFSTDTASVEELTSVKNLFTGNIMEGWYLKNCNDFNEMVLFDRMLCENKQIEILKALAYKYESGNEFDKSLEVLKELSTLEPDDEKLALQIMKTYIASGCRTAAINYYRVFETNLWNNLSITPNDEITCFYKSLLENKLEPEINKVTPPIIRDNKKSHEIKVFCLEQVEYFLISNIIGKLLDYMSSEQLLQLHYDYIFDLSFIQREIIIKYEEYIKHKNICLMQDRSTDMVYTPVRIVNAFYKFIELLTSNTSIVINVVNSKNADTVSLKTLDYLNLIRFKNLTINLL